MKKTSPTNLPQPTQDDMRSEYHFDYSKARRNRFAGQIAQDRLVVVLDPDISEVFTTPEAVKAVLRALITTMPRSPQSKKSQKSSLTKGRQ